jgi:esterase
MKALDSHATVYALDLPNHGKSPHTQEINFDSMTEAVLEWLQDNGLEKVHLLGHSLGGKVAMHLADLHPDLLESLIVSDIAPKGYEPHSQEILEAMDDLDLSAIQSRKEAEEILSANVPGLGMRKFVLTNLVRTAPPEAPGFQWQVNLKGLLRALPEISSNPLLGKIGYAGKTLIIKGEHSDYILPEDISIFEHHFPNSTLHTIPDSGHNVHFDNLPAFTEALLHHLND